MPEKLVVEQREPKKQNRNEIKQREPKKKPPDTGKRKPKKVTTGDN